jgi:hypothetical protein
MGKIREKRYLVNINELKYEKIFMESLSSGYRTYT